MSEAQTQTNGSPSVAHWRIGFEDGIAILSIDRADASQNSINQEVIVGLEKAIDYIASHGARGLILKSAKPDNFIVGADVSTFAQVTSPQEALPLVRQAHSVFDKLENLRMPTVAIIEGNCLGGGLELALCCRYLVASDADNTRLGLPEVLLGIHPGFGGSVRLIERVGPSAGMDMMLTGRGLRAKQAKRIGLVNSVVPPRHLNRAALQLLAKEPKRASLSLKEKALNSAVARPLLARIMRGKVKARAHPDHYPAPYALIDVWEKYGSDRRAMLDAEAESISQLIVTPTSRNLVRVFFLQERLKSEGKAARDATESDLDRVQVIGAGVMGGDIAAWCATRGLSVSLQDLSAQALAGAMKRAAALFKKRLRDKRLVTAGSDRLMPDTTGDGVRHADLVIEAIVERLDVKQSVFKDLEKKAAAHTVLATNTSSIPLEEISSALTDPSRLVGIHFFNPVAKMQLVEIVVGKETAAEHAEKAAAFTHGIGRLPVKVLSSPGFLVNRVLTPYLLEAVSLLQEGVPAIAIDKAATEFGMPMGPIELADTVGLDICLHVGTNLSEAFGGEVPSQLTSLVDDGNLGKKSGRGFYVWHRGKPQKRPLAKDARIPMETEDRLILRYLNECVACLREGVVADADLLDAGMIFGTGFAPFRGGPMHYINQRGAAYLKQRLTTLTEQHGERFTPDAGWDELVKAEEQASA